MVLMEMVTTVTMGLMAALSLLMVINNQKLYLLPPHHQIKIMVIKT